MVTIGTFVGGFATGWFVKPDNTPAPHAQNAVKGQPEQAKKEATPPKSGVAADKKQ